MSNDEKVDLAVSGLQGVKKDVQGLKQELQGVKEDAQGLKQDVSRIELHIENTTDKNVQLIAESFSELAKRLSQVIPADKNLIYEMKLNHLIAEIAILKQEVANLESKIT